MSFRTETELNGLYGGREEVGLCRDMVDMLSLSGC